MTLDPAKNFGKVTVSGQYNASQYQITVNNASRLPDPGASGPYNIVWYNDTEYPDPADDPNVEIARVISVSGNVLTLANSGGNRTPQEGTSASAKSTAGRTYKIILALTAKMITDIQTALNAKANTGDNISVFVNNAGYITAAQAPVQSVNGKTGTVVLSTSDISEGSNLYYTTARFDSRLATKTTDNLTEGSINLYFTSARADARITAQKGFSNGLATLDGSGKVPTSQLPAAILGDVKYYGTWDANANTPALASSIGTQGAYYIVSVAGITNLDGITDWKLGDWAIFNGTTWNKVDNTDAVISVNGMIGAVSLTTSNIAEGSNLYFTAGRAVTALTGQNISIFTNDLGYITASALTSYAKLDGSNGPATGDWNFGTHKIYNNNWSLNGDGSASLINSANSINFTPANVGTLGTEVFGIHQGVTNYFAVYGDGTIYGTSWFIGADASLNGFSGISNNGSSGGFVLSTLNLGTGNAQLQLNDNSAPAGSPAIQIGSGIYLNYDSTASFCNNNIVFNDPSATYRFQVGLANLSYDAGFQTDTGIMFAPSALFNNGITLSGFPESTGFYNAVGFSTFLGNFYIGSDAFSSGLRLSDGSGNAIPLVGVSTLQLTTLYTGAIQDNGGNYFNGAIILPNGAGGQLNSYDVTNRDTLALDWQARKLYASDGTTEVLDWSSGVAAFAGNVVGASVRGKAVAYASRPGTPVEGMIVAFTDSTTNTWGATIAGGGANHVLGYYNGTNWTVIGK